MMKRIQPREQFGRLLGETHRLWRLRMDERLRPLGLSQARWITLLALARGGDAKPQTELAAAVGVEAPTLVGILDGLVNSGFVRRHVSTGDRRVKTVHLTESARRMLNQIEKVAHDMRREVTAKIDSETLATAIDALEAAKQQLVAMATAEPATAPAASSKRQRRSAPAALR
jgi:MarR family transcriptional regulator for hemolysin